MTADGKVEAVLASAITAARHARRRTAAVVWTGRALLLAGLLGSWQLASGPLLDPAFVSRPTDVATAWLALAANGTLLNEGLYTLGEFVSGYTMGACLGVLAACLVTVRRLHYRILEPFLFVLFSIPKLALAPLLGLWFGLGVTPKIVLAALVTFLLVLMSTVAGIRSANQQQLGLLRIMGARPWQTYSILTIPHAIPYILTALRLAMPLAMVSVILAEFLGSMGGLGHVISEQATFLAVDKMLAVIVTLAALVAVLRFALLPIEQLFSRHTVKSQGDMRP